MLLCSILFFSCFPTVFTLERENDIAPYGTTFVRTILPYLASRRKHFNKYVVSYPTMAAGDN
jgi:hypothetical protein